MIADPLVIAIAIFAVLIVGLSKGGMGGGIGILGTLSLATVIPPAQAVAIMLPILCMMDPMGVWAYRRSWHRPSATLLIGGGMVGVTIGALSFRYLDDQAIRLLVGSVSVAFTLDQMLRGAERAFGRRLQTSFAGAALGACSGFTSFVIHAGLPPVAMYLLPQQLDRKVYVGTIMITFFCINYAKLIPYAWLGLFSTENLMTSLLLAPLAPLGMWAGVRLNRRFTNLWFYRLTYAALFCMGLKMIYDGLAPMWK